MPTKYIPIRGATTYKFGGGGGEVQVSDPADTTNYSVDLGGGDDRAILGAGSDTVVGGKGSDWIEGGGGDDLIYAGIAADYTTRKFESDVLYGDNFLASGTGSYSDDSLHAASGSSYFQTTAYGDTAVLASATGGEDTLYGGALATNTLYGDAQTFNDGAVGGSDTLYGGDNASNGLYGDAHLMHDGSVGGADHLYGGDWATNTLLGDANFMYAGATGGADYLEGGFGAGVNYLYGDAYELEGTEGSLAVGGGDVLVGGADCEANGLYGDGNELYQWSQGGDDTLYGGTGSAGNYLFGDAYRLQDNAQGGDDILYGRGTTTNSLTGDAVFGHDSAVCGDDVLHAANGTMYNFLTGDVQQAHSSLMVFGSDILWAGSGTDKMWGDAQTVEQGFSIVGGADDFVFGGGLSGVDDIYDFEAGKDQIYVLTNLPLADYSILEEGGSTFIWLTDETNDNRYLNRIEVVGVTGLDIGTDVIFEPASAY